jgi:hypothetical protein
VFTHLEARLLASRCGLFDVSPSLFFGLHILVLPVQLGRGLVGVMHGVGTLGRGRGRGLLLARLVRAFVCACTDVYA